MPILPKNKIIHWNFIISFILNLLLWLFLYWRIQPQVEPVVLRSNIYFGISLIGGWYTGFFWPLIGLIILIINFILANIFIKNQRFLAYFLMLTATLCQIVLVITSFFAVLLNG